MPKKSKFRSESYMRCSGHLKQQKFVVWLHFVMDFLSLQIIRNPADTVVIKQYITIYN